MATGQSSAAASERAALPAGQAPNGSAPKNDLSRRQLVLLMLDQAQLTIALLGHIRSHKRAFLAQGARIPNVESMKPEAMIKMLRTLQPKAYSLVEDWILKSTTKELDAFLAEQKQKDDANSAGNGKSAAAAEPEKGKQKNEPAEELTQAGRLRLAEKLCGLFAAGNRAVQWSREEVVSRSMLLLACMHSKRTDLSEVAWKVSELANRNINYGVRLTNMNSMVDVVLDTGKDAGASNSDSFELALLAAATAVRAGDYAGAKHAIEVVSEHERAYASGDELPLTGRLTAAIGKFKPSYGIRARRTRHAAQAQHASANTLEVMAQCFSVKDQLDAGRQPFAFSNVIAVREQGTEDWHEVNREETERLFPQSGSLIHFSGRNQPELPRNGALGVYRVEEQVFSDVETDGQRTKQTRVKAISRLHHIHQVMILAGIPSTKPDMVREWITSNISRLQERDEGNVLLHLEDGLLINGPYSDMVKEGFTQKFRCWRGVRLHQTTTNLMLHIGELPAVEEHYDVTPPVRAAVRALRDMQEFTADDKRKLAHALECIGEHQALAARLSTAGIAEMEWGEEAIKEFEGLVESLPSVREQVAAIRQQSQQDADTQLAERREELKRANDEHSRVLKMIEGKNESMSRLSKDLHHVAVEQIQEAQRTGLKYVIKRAFELGVNMELSDMLKDQAAGEGGSNGATKGSKAKQG